MQIYEIFIFDHNNYLKKFSITFFVKSFFKIYNAHALFTFNKF